MVPPPTSTTSPTDRQTCEEREAPARAATSRFTDPTGAQVATWEELVRRYQPYLLRVAHSYRMGEEAQDVVQHAFLRLLEHEHDIRDRQAMGSWLVTVVRRECLRLARRRLRERPCEHDALTAALPSATDADVDATVLRTEAVGYVRLALQQLPASQRQLLELLAEPDTSSYRCLAERLDMPMGSIGPTRQRALARLKATLASLQYDVDLAG